MKVEALVALSVLSLPPGAGAAPLPCDPTSSVDPRRELRIEGRVNELSWSPAGPIWLTTATGNTYVADRLGGDWKEGTLQLGSKDDRIGTSIDRITFFDANTAVATGHFRGIEDMPDPIYRTTDAGRSWQPVSSGTDEWIYDVFTNNAGEGWMGGSSGSFLHSSDAGRTWEARTAPFDQSTRTHTIFMASSTAGYVGALHDAIRRTTDGGSTWRDVPTPFQQGRYPKLRNDQRQHRIENIAMAEGLLVVEQEGRVFRSAPDRVDWKAFVPELVTFAVDRSTGRMVGVTKDLWLVQFDASLAATRLADEPLRSRPLSVQSVGGTVMVLDENYGIYRVAEGRLEFGYALRSSGPTTPMGHVRRRGDVLWGATTHHVYNSRDQGESWCRVGEVSFDIDGFAVKDEDRILLWDGHGTNALFDRRSGRVHAVAGLGADDVIDVLTLPGLWVAYGGRQFETAGRVEVSRTFFGDQFRGIRENGFVRISRDSGDTWTRIDEWREGGVARAFVAPDGDLVLLSYLGSVRRLDRSEHGYRATNLIVATERNRDGVPYVERADALYFADDRTGYVSGSTHWLGDKAFKTTDGGRTWRPIPGAEFPYRNLVPVRKGYVASDARGVVLLRAAGAEPVVAASPVLTGPKSFVSDLSLDDSGRILVEVSSEEPPGTERARSWISIPMP